MTQALLNNLTILTDDKFNQSDKFAKEDFADFANILSIKTNSNKTEKTNDNDTQSTEINNQSTIINTITDTANETKKITIADIKNTETDNDKLENVIENTLLEAEVIESIGYMLVQEEIEQTEEIDDTDNNDENTTTDTVTIEEPTMNNEELIYRQPLENPAASMMLQSQLQKHSFRENQEDSESNDNGNNNLLKSNDNNKIAKDFDSMQKSGRDTFNINLAEKDNSTQKLDIQKSKDVIDKKMVEDLHITSIESEAGNTENDSSNLMNNQTPQEQAVKAMLDKSAGVNVDKISGIEAREIQVVSTAKNSTTAEVNASKILEQITKQMEGMYNGSKVNIVLNPESLGKVSLQLINLKEGLAAQFTVTSQDAQNAIMKGLSGLKENLLAHGINVDSVTVKLQETDNNEQNLDWTEQESSRGGYKQQNPQRQKENEKQFEQTMFEISKNGKV